MTKTSNPSPQCPFSVDDKKASERVAGVVEINAVIFRDLVRQIGKEGNVELAQTAVFPRRLRPREMRELRIHGHAHDFGVDGAEFRRAITGGGGKNRWVKGCRSNVPGGLSHHILCQGSRRVPESDDLRGTNEGEIQWIKEKYEIFSLEHVEI